MHKTAFVLACLACAGHGRRAQGSDVGLRGDLHIESQKPIRSEERISKKATVDPWEALAKLLLGFTSATAFSSGVRLPLHNPTRGYPCKPGLRMCARPSVTIDVTSDLACPWCYVGLKRLQNAIDRSDVDVDLRFHPYLIDPDTDKQGEPYLAYNQRRWGSDGWVGGMKAGAFGDGCEFKNWGRDNPESVWAYTMEAHRLLYFVREKAGWSGMSRMKAILFDEYYEKGTNISLLDELIMAGKRFLDESEDASPAFTVDELTAFMKDPQGGRKEVLEECLNAQMQGVTSVPNFKVEGIPQVIGGAQPTEWWAGIFQQLSESV